MLTPVGEHDLLLFWIQLAVLLGAARLLGGAARRCGQPPVVGELAAGLLVGPSVLGRVAPGAAEWLFPGGEVTSALLLAVAWLGIVLLLLATGFETDLGLLRSLGRRAASVSLGSLLLPLGLGLALGWAMPDSLLGPRGGRLGFALFMAVALSISALPVVAKILGDMGLMRRNFGQITVAAGMANDLVGWLLLGVASGIVTSGDVPLTRLGVVLAAVIAFVAVSLTIGQRLADGLLRRARSRADGFTAALSATVLVTLVASAVTHAIGVEAVLGALVAGIVLGRSKYQRGDVRATLESLSGSVFAPVFFATAGLYVDLGVLFEGTNWVWALVVIAVASLSKLAGSYVGARMSRMDRMEALAIGIGLNARGALEIVVATLGLALGALNEVSYGIVVVMALATSMAAPPLLRPVLRRIVADPDEAARLEREEVLSESIIAGVRTALLPTRGGMNSAAAAQILDLVLQPGASVTVLTVTRPGDGDGQVSEQAIQDHILPALRGHDVERRRHTADDPGADIVAETGLGYGLLAIGLNDDFAGTHELSAAIGRVIAESPVPILLIKRGRRLAPGEVGTHVFRRVLVPITGSRVGLAAEEIAYTVARRLDADVQGVHVVERTGRFAVWRGRGDTPAQAESEMARARLLASRFGRDASVLVRTGQPQDQILQAAREHDSDLIVLGARTRSHGGTAFLGYTAEHVLTTATCTVVAVMFPPRGEGA